MNIKNTTVTNSRRGKLRRMLFGGRWGWAKRGVGLGCAVLLAVLYFNAPGIHAATATVVPISDIQAGWAPVPAGTHYTALDEGTTASTTDYVHTGTGVSATPVPTSDVQTGWITSTGTSHYTLVDEGTTASTADYVHTGTASSTSATDEYKLTAAPAPGPTSTVILSVYAESATNANGGNLDDLSINLNVNGSLQTASTCTPSYNSWGWCTATFSGSWTSTDVANMSAVISNTINGSGNPNNRDDDLLVADAYASFSSNALVTDEYGLTNVPAAASASQMVLNVYAQSATNANGGSLDTLSINLKVNGSLQTASTCTPSYNSWGWCTATFSGSWTSTDVANMSAVISNTVNGSSAPEDDIQVADVYGTLTYNSAPSAPTLSGPASGATAVSTTPAFSFSATDSDSDYLRYKLYLYQSDCSTPVGSSPFIEPSGTPQTGWTGQNAQTGTAYTSGTIATYTYQGVLSAGTTYCWKAAAIDPGGSNTYGSDSGTRTFTTNFAPAAPGLSAPPSGATGVSTSPAFTFSATDTEGDYLRYKLYLYQSDCSTPVGSSPFIEPSGTPQTGWTGQNAQTGTAYLSGSTATYTYQASLSAGTPYCWQAQAIDPGGSNTYSTVSAARSFTTNAVPAAPTLVSPASGATGQATNNLAFTLRTTDANSDYLMYRIYLYQSDCSTGVDTFDQALSQTGWGGQDASGGTAYTGSSTLASSTLATHTYGGTLAANSTYCWQAQALDPAGSSSWSTLSATRLFTTNGGATMLNLGGNLNIRGGTRFGN